MKSVSLRLVLVVPFVLQISVAVGLTGYFSIRNGQKAVESLASQLCNEVSNRIDQHLDGYLKTPSQINQMAIDTIAQGLIAPNDFAALGRYFWGQAKQFNVGYINYGFATGEFAGAGFVESQQTKRPVIGETLTPKQFHSFSTDSQGNRRQAVLDSSYDHRQEAWYIDAVRAGKPVWSNIYIWDIRDGKNPYVSIALSEPLRNSQGQIVGAIGVDLLLTQMSEFLRLLEVSPHGKAFILERNGLLVASSSFEPPYVEAAGGVRRLRAIDSTDPLIRSTAQYLTDHNSLAAIQTSQQLDFDFQGERQYVQVTPWRDQYGLDWLVVIAVPKSDFMGQIYANTRTTILLCSTLR